MGRVSPALRAGTYFLFGRQKIVIYYVYAYFESHTPIYVGAGCGKRDILHLCPYTRGCRYFHNKLRKMQRDGQEPSVRRLLDRLTFQESRDWERFFIQAIGRKNLGTGSLYNLTDGGRAQRIQLCQTPQNKRCLKQ